MPRKYTKKTDLVKSFFRNITVEPVTLLVCMSLGSFYILSPEIMIQKVCRVNMQLNKTVCDEIQKHDELQVLVQKKVSTLQIWHNVLMAVPSAIFMLFAGSWSDVHGRRFIMLSSVLLISACFINNELIIMNPFQVSLWLGFVLHVLDHQHHLVRRTQGRVLTH